MTERKIILSKIVIQHFFPNENVTEEQLVFQNCFTDQSFFPCQPKSHFVTMDECSSHKIDVNDANLYYLFTRFSSVYLCSCTTFFNILIIVSMCIIHDLKMRYLHLFILDDLMRMSSFFVMTVLDTAFLISDLAKLKKS